MTRAEFLILIDKASRQALQDSLLTGNSFLACFILRFETVRRENPYFERCVDCGDFKQITDDTVCNACKL